MTAAVRHIAATTVSRFEARPIRGEKLYRLEHVTADGVRHIDDLTLEALVTRARSLPSTLVLMPEVAS